MISKQPQTQKKLLTAIAVGLVALICLMVFISNLQPGNWLISQSLSYPELIQSGSLQAAIDLDIASGQLQHLPATVVSMLLSLFMADSFVRYFYMGLLIVAAGTGMFALCRQWLRSARYADTDSGAVAGAVTYIASGFIVQSIYAVNTPLVTAFALVPWLVWAAHMYITTGARKWLLIFLVASTLGLEAASNPWAYIAIMIFVSILCAAMALDAKRGKLRALVLILLNIVVNLIWLVPAIFNGKFVSVGAIDATVSQHLPLLSQLISNGSISTAAQLTQFRSDWISHWESPVIGAVFWLPLVLGLLSAVWMIIAKRGVYRLAAVMTLLATFTLIIINVGIEMDSLSWPEIGSLKQVLSLISGIGIAIMVSRFAQWALTRQLGRLNRSAALALAVSAVSMAFYFGLAATPAIQNHLYPVNSQAHLPESFTQLYSYLHDNATPGNILYIEENAQQDPASYEFRLNSTPLNRYAINSAIISSPDPATRTLYHNLINIISSGNHTQIESAWEKYDVEWLVVDQSVLDSQSQIQAARMSSVIARLDSLEHIDRIDAGGGELAIFKVTSNKHTSELELLSPAPFASLPAPLPTTLQPEQQYTVSTSHTGIMYPFRNLPADRMDLNPTSSTLRLISTIPAGQYENINFPALASLKLEAVSLTVSESSGRLTINLRGAYPVMTGDDKALNPDLANLQLVSIKAPVTQYVLVIGEQSFGPFAPGSSNTVRLDVLDLKATQNLRIYELYDSNDATGLFKLQQARNCVTYELIPGATTSVTAAGVSISSPEDICIAGDLPVVETDASVLTITSYDYMANTSLTQCMFSKKGSDCINRNLPDLSSPDGIGHHVQIIEELGKVGTNELQTKFFLRRTGSQSTRAATLNNIRISEFKLAQSVTLDVSAWSTPHTIAIGQTATLQAVLQFKNIAAADFNSGEYVDSFITCNDAQQKRELVPQQDQRVLQVSATGELCVQKDLPSVDSSRGHVLMLDHKLAEGESVHLCVWDVSASVCLQAMDLEGNDIRQQSLLSIPRFGDGMHSYRLIFTADSSTRTELTLSDIRLMEFNPDTLQSIYLSSGLPVAQATVAVDNTGVISIADDQQNSHLLKLPHPNSGLDLVTSSGVAVPAVTLNNWQSGWHVQPGDYKLVDRGKELVQVVLLAQLALLILIVGVPLTKEILVQGIIKRGTERDGRESNSQPSA